MYKINFSTTSYEALYSNAIYTHHFKDRVCCLFDTSHCKQSDIHCVILGPEFRAPSCSEIHFLRNAVHSNKNGEYNICIVTKNGQKQHHYSNKNHFARSNSQWSIGFLLTV